MALVSRGDPLTPYLHAAIAARYPVVGEVGVELHGWRRAAVAATTFRLPGTAWKERYMKSQWGFELRSGLATRGLRALGPYDAVVQTHALFDCRSDRAFVYVDCTYRQAMAGWPGWTPQRGRARARWLQAEIGCYRTARHLFAFTEQTRRSLVEDYGIDGQRITVVGAGMNFDERQVDQRERGRPNVDAPTILFVGKDFERKGCDVLLDAFEQVRRAVPAARLQIVGAGVPGAVPPGVEAIGVVQDRDRLNRLYREATLFCLPSRFDPSPLVVLEAMAHGLPCVLSRASSQHVPGLLVDVHDLDGSPDTTGTGDTVGIAVAPGDPSELAQALLVLLRDPDRAAAYGKRAQQVVRERYRWQHVVDRMAPALEATVPATARSAGR